MAIKVASSRDIGLPKTSRSADDRLALKVRTLPGFDPSEREAILRALSLSDHSSTHLYPRGCSPASSAYAEIAWHILDRIEPDSLSTKDRFAVGAEFTAALRHIHLKGLS